MKKNKIGLIFFQIEDYKRFILYKTVKIKQNGKR